MNNPTVLQLKTPDQRHSETCVKLLEDLLEQAKSGEVVNVAVAAILSDRTIWTSASSSEKTSELIGAVSILHHRMLNVAVE